MKTNASKPKNIKENNLRLILSKMYAQREMTAQSLATATGISKTTVCKLIIELVNAGIILSEGKGESTSEGGRKPELYRFNEKYKYIISTELFEDSSYCCVMDLGCHILYNDIDEYEQILEFEDSIERLKKNIQQGLEETGINQTQVGAVVVSCSAIVDEKHGRIEASTIGSWKGEHQVAAKLQPLFSENVPIIVNNIARFSGYGELQRNEKLRNERVATLLFWDDTVGGAVITNGQYENGANHMVGEIGHIVVEHSAEDTEYDDVSGQLENMTNSDALLRYVYEKRTDFNNSVLDQQIENKSLCLEDVFRAYKENDALAIAAVNKSAYYIALAMHYISIIYDPKYFII